MDDFPTRFDVATCEVRIARWWEEQGFFAASASSPRPPYTIVIPPPNVTGTLHIGHALNNTLQDILVRYRRMDGCGALWLPGTDHAGIATQFVVEKELKKEGKTRWDLGREAFLERVWAWKEEYGGRILAQLRRLGASCDWSRTRFTMDEHYSHAVRFAFVSLFRRGLIVQDYTTVNWCPRCRTALSDIEVERREEAGHLWTVRYPLRDGGFIPVATTRPETILGDTAIAVHPDDSRWAAMVGRRAIVPVVGREIPVIADSFVDPGFGTGAVKVTPAHDMHDFECARRHGLPRVLVMDESGRMNREAGPFEGQDRFACRQALLERLRQEGLVEKQQEHTVPLGYCYRCATVIEPYLSREWFLRMKPLVVPAIEAVHSGRLRFHPARFARVYVDWLENARDWCISRRLWWGHRIPVWHCPCGATLASMDDVDRCPQCGGGEAQQDEHVLDTWFSSAQWPLATLGWPRETPDFERFYPTQTLVTGRDIIFLWVARMVIMGYQFAGECPFSDVVVHPTIQTLEGRRMSKSLGTGVDPLEMIERHGADALRFGLVVQVSSAQDLRFAPDRIQQARNFVTKLWNAARFVRGFAPPEALGRKVERTALEDRWILSAAHSATQRITGHLDAFEFGDAARALWQFVWDQFCDWYIEIVKRRSGDPAAQTTLAEVLVRILKLAHPVIPFVTEEIWSRLRACGWPLEEPAIAISAWPEIGESAIQPALEEGMGILFEVVRGVREVRHRMNIGRSVPLNALVVPKDDAADRALRDGAPVGRFLAGVERWEVRPGATRPPLVAAVVASRFTLYVPLAGRIDIHRERQRQDRRRAQLQGQLAAAEAKLADASFRSKAPPDVRARQEEQRDALRGRLAEVEEVLRALDEDPGGA